METKIKSHSFVNESFRRWIVHVSLRGFKNSGRMVARLENKYCNHVLVNPTGATRQTVALTYHSVGTRKNLREVVLSTVHYIIVRFEETYRCSCSYCLYLLISHQFYLILQKHSSLYLHHPFTFNTEPQILCIIVHDPLTTIQ